MDHLLEELESLFSLIDTLESSLDNKSEDIRSRTSDVKGILRTMIQRIQSGEYATELRDSSDTQNVHGILQGLYKILGHISNTARDSGINTDTMWRIESTAVHCVDIAQNLEFNTITGSDASYHEQTVSFAERAADILLCVCLCADIISDDETNKKEICSSLARMKHAIGLSSIISTNTPFIFRQDAAFLTRFHAKHAFEQLKRCMSSEKRHVLGMIERTVNFYCAALDYYSDLRLYEPAIASGNHGHFAISLNIFEAILLTRTLISKFEGQKVQKELDVLLHKCLVPAKESLEKAFKYVTEQNGHEAEPNYDSVHTHLDDARVKLENICEEHIDTNVIAIISKVITGVLRTIDIIDGEIPVHSGLWDRTKTSLPLFPFEAPVSLPTLENIYSSRSNVTQSYASLLSRQEMRAHVEEQARMAELQMKQKALERAGLNTQHDSAPGYGGHHAFAVGIPYSHPSQAQLDAVKSRFAEPTTTASDMMRSHSAPMVTEHPNEEELYTTMYSMNSRRNGSGCNSYKAEHVTEKSTHTKKGGFLNAIKSAFTAVFNFFLGILKTVCRVIKNLFLSRTKNYIASTTHCSSSGCAEEHSVNAKPVHVEKEKQKSEATPQIPDKPSHKLEQHIVEEQRFSKESSRTR
ncbi:MAG: hypothetical protein AB8U44_02520 [Aaplasma endosymbiont of Hyalomma asiaticum]